MLLISNTFDKSKGTLSHHTTLYALSSVEEGTKISYQTENYWDLFWLTNLNFIKIKGVFNFFFKKINFYLGQNSILNFLVCVALIIEICNLILYIVHIETMYRAYLLETIYHASHWEHDSLIHTCKFKK